MERAASTEQQNERVARLLYSEEHRESAAALAFYRHDVEWDMTHYPGWLDSPRYRGHAGVREFMTTWLGSFDDWTADIETAETAGEAVLLVIRDRARVAGSNAWIERRFGHLFRFRDGLVAYSACYQDVEEARRALRG